MMTRRISSSRAALAGSLMALVLALPVVAWTQGQQDFSQVQIKTTKLAYNFYTLDGQGGTIGVLTGPDGVFMVDAQFAPLTEKIVTAIKQISDGRIRVLVNTHVHALPDSITGWVGLMRHVVVRVIRARVPGRSPVRQTDFKLRHYPATYP